GLSRFSFRDWKKTSDSIANRLAAAGVKKGDPVFLSGQNHPSWPMAYFGIQKAGAVAVPVDCTMDATPFCNVLRSSGAKVAIWDREVEKKAGHVARATFADVRIFDLHEIGAEGQDLPAPDVKVEPNDLASIIY